MLKLYDGSEVGLYTQAPGEFVFNQMLTADECMGDWIWYAPVQTKTPVCTLLNNGYNANGGEDLTYPQVQYFINSKNRVIAVTKSSPTLIPCWSGTGSEEAYAGVPLVDTDFGRWYWNENMSGVNDFDYNTGGFIL